MRNKITLPQTLPLVPRPQPEPSNRVRAQILSGIIANERAPKAIAQRKSLRAIYRTHPYSRPNDGAKESLAANTQTDLSAA
ncbi:hypothetical protein [Mesorhizobium sp. L48C026A00]|uniref:hypothetical protein n=1 Tax=Mesorhizobium sp. L48C026A00 TaxID=1287182 RepID=UPI0003CFE480|nr:hypothetical protein [Mesorhizobium sp. L48C026A00]ESZ12179.1 hypothetical protein X737_27635 [Mesorhizobium sp. L48C026A00]